MYNPAEKSFTIHDLPVAERPRERLQRYGEEALSAQELLAVILGRGIAGESIMVTAQRLLKEFGSLKGLAQASVQEMGRVKGIGPAKACQLKAAFELASRVEQDSHLKAQEKQVLKIPPDVLNYVRNHLKEKKKEYFVTILLDTRGQVIKHCEVSVGSLDSSIVHPREVFKEAIAASAASVILVHNHPSGDPTPSEEDIGMNKKLTAAGELLGISVLDHLIIGNPEFLSFKAKGIF
ncbi:MAG: DNA repair protein RadC [Dehalococcoidia bacterium]|nr:DNA repair protein RadC [Dehalococcoidia bacterium]